MNLGVVNNPDSTGSACDFQPFSFYLGGKRTYVGLPNNPNYSLGPLVDSFCDTVLVANELFEEDNNSVLFPNPAVNEVTYTSSRNFNDQEKLMVFNSHGQKIEEYGLLRGASSLTFNVSKYQKGIYFVKHSSVNQSFADLKLVIIR
jgi:hypothetical protein